MTSRTEAKALAMLRSNPLTYELETKHLKKLASLAKEIKFEPDEMIYRRGDRGKALYLILEGEVVIEMVTPEHGPMILNRLGEGQFFGWSSLFPLEHKMAWTRATSPTRVLAFDADRLREAEFVDHNFEYAIARCAGRDMINRLKATRQMLMKIPAL